MQLWSDGAILVLTSRQALTHTTMNSTSQSKKEKDPVTIKINGTGYTVSPGNHTVVELKQLGGVPLADDLNEIKNKKPHVLKDDGSTHIEGEEVFVSNPKGSGASHQ